jgi:hypothetical protein
MGLRLFDQTVFIAEDDKNTSTSTNYHYLSISGDTILLATDRTIDKPDQEGNKGEICWNKEYLYICIDNNSWRRVPLNIW